MNLSKKIARQFYNSAAWFNCKEAYLEKMNHLCERCLKEGKYTPAEIVHHKTYLTDENFGDQALMFGFDNLECLCAAHHNEEHKTKTNERRWKFIDGQLICRDLE